MSKMLEEIREQPAALERTLKAELRGFEQLRARFAKERPKFVVLAARGHLGQRRSIWALSD